MFGSESRESLLSCGTQVVEDLQGVSSVSCCFLPASGNFSVPAGFPPPPFAGQILLCFEDYFKPVLWFYCEIVILIDVRYLE